MKRPGHTLTILSAPAFDRTYPPRDATIWRVSLSASRAFKLLCDIEHHYPSPIWHPRIGGMLEQDGAWTLYLWPKADPDSALLLLMLGYGAARLCDAIRWTGQAWVTGDLLGKVLAKLATRAHWDFAERVADRYWREPLLASDDVPGYLLSLERQVAG
jgi:hypothetical protein